MPCSVKQTSKNVPHFHILPDAVKPTVDGVAALDVGICYVGKVKQGVTV